MSTKVTIRVTVKTQDYTLEEFNLDKEVTGVVVDKEDARILMRGLSNHLDRAFECLSLKESTNAAP